MKHLLRSFLWCLGLGTWDMLGFQIGWLSSLVSRLASFVAGNDGMMADSLESICCDQEPLLTFQPGADVQHRKEKVGSAFPWPWAVVASALLRFSQGTSHGSAGVEDVDWDERRTSSLIGYENDLKGVMLCYTMLYVPFQNLGDYHNPRNGVPINQQGLVAKKLKLISPGIDSPNPARQWNFLDVKWANARGLAAWWVPFWPHTEAELYFICIYIYIYVCVRVCFFHIVELVYRYEKSIWYVYIYIHYAACKLKMCVFHFFPHAL